MAAWHQWELAVYGLLSVVPPLAVYFLEERRRRHWLRCLAVTRGRASANAELLWRSLHTRVWEGHRLELGCCAEHSLGWIDMFANVAAPLVPNSIRESRAASPLEWPQPPPPPPPPPPPRLLDVPRRPKPRQADKVRAVTGIGAHEAPECNGGPSGDADAAPSADRARSAPAPAAMLVDSSPPTDGWALEGRAQRLGLGLVDDGWAGAEAEAGAWHGLNGEDRVRHGSERGARGRRDERERDTATGAAEAAEAAEADVMRPQPRTLFDAVGVFGRINGVASGAASPPPTQLLEQRVAYQLCLCGSGTFLSPYHLEMSDFLVYTGMSAALGEVALTPNP